jgi:hypothetical protein
MPAASDVELEQMCQYLKSGPVLIGENHETPHGRLAVRTLIERQVVRFLSIEAPIGPLGLVRADGQLQTAKLADYFNAASFMTNPTMSMEQLVRLAAAQQVAVYCHDVPSARSPLNFLGRVGDDMTVNPTYAARFLPPSMPRLPAAAQAASKYIQRNEYSANYLKAHLGAGVRVLQNLVLLAGADHLDPGLCGQGRTLQAHLGVADRRAYLLN